MLSQVYPEYSQMFLFGNEGRISLTKFNISSRFCSARGSPPRNEILFIYGLLMRLRNSFSTSFVHSLPPLKSHVSGLKQL